MCADRQTEMHMQDVQMHAEGTLGSPAPRPVQWQKLWRLWDAATLKMIPPGRYSDRWVDLTDHPHCVLPASVSDSHC